MGNPSQNILDNFDSPIVSMIIHRGSMPFIILLITTIHLSASINIKGHVQDKATKAPVAGANVLVKGTDEGSATDAKGNFQFRTSTTFPLILQVSHIGFAAVEVLVTDDTQLVITLEPALLRGVEVLVTGQQSQLGADVSTSVEVINLRTIETYGGRDVGDILRPLPSVSIIASNTGKQFVSIRGSNPNEVAVFLDGLRINDAATGLANLSAIDLNDIEQIEVVKGGASTLFGPGAFGGIVNLTSRLPDSNKVTFIRGFGQTDQVDQDLSMGAAGRFGFLAAGGNYSGKSRRYDGSSIYTSIFSSLAGAAYPQRGELFAKRYHLDNFLELPGGSLAQSDNTVLTNLSYRGSLLSSPDWTFFLGHREWDWEDHFFSNLERDLSEENITGRIAHQIVSKTLSSTLQADYEVQEFVEEDLLYNSILDTNYLTRSRLTRTNTGYTAVIRILSDDVSPAVSHIRWELSLRTDRFKTDHLYSAGGFNQIGNQTEIETEVTLEKGVTDYSNTGRMGVRVEGRTEWLIYNVFMNQGRNQRPPSLNDLALWANDQDPQLPAPPLKNEHLSTTDIGLELFVRPREYLYADMELNFSASLFGNDYSNKIAYSYSQYEPPRPLNVPTANISGYDLSMGYSLLNRRLRGRIAYQHLNLDNPLIHPNKPESRLTYLFEINLPWLVLAYDYYRDGPQFILLNGFVGSQLVTGRESSNLNASLRYHIGRVQLSLSYTIRNLFSDEPVPAQDLATDSIAPFQYYESHRRIITFRIKL